jgi:hypothetical protein
MKSAMRMAVYAKCGKEHDGARACSRHAPWIESHIPVRPGVSPRRTMAKIKATTVKEYLKSLPEDRREIISAVRDVIVRNLPDGYRESINWGVIAYEISLERFPDTYNGQPLSYVCLASQKNHCALYLMCAYGDPKKLAWLKNEFKKAGKKLNMGKACLRFKKLDDLPLEAIGKLVGEITPEQYISWYEKHRHSK